MKKTDPPIAIEASYPKSRTALWHALTEHSEMKKWYFEMLPDFRARVGFKTSFEVHTGNRTFTHLWEVTEIVEGSKIAYRWNYAEYHGSCTSVCEISGDENRSHLKLTVLVQEDFPEDIPEFKRESCQDGWDYFLLGNLKNYLSV